MRRIQMKNRKIHSIITGLVVLSSVIATNSEAGYTEPGSQSDPLVTKSYVDKKFNEVKGDIKNEIDAGVKSNLGNIKDKLDSIERDIKLLKLREDKDDGKVEIISAKFAVLELKRGQKILADESTEIILRSGVATALGSASGGISDITKGCDLVTGDSIEKNHLIIIPRTDNRGLEVKSNTIFVMVKGKYRIG